MPCRIEANCLKQIVVKHHDLTEAEGFWNSPYPTLGEAVVNAVYHRSYDIREPIEVRITPEGGQVRRAGQEGRSGSGQRSGGQVRVDLKNLIPGNQ